MNIAGFYWVDTSSRFPKYLPQVRLEAHASILSSISRTSLTQTFINSSAHLPEIRYSFPLYDGVSVVGFTCNIGERVINGVVKEKHQARQVYNKATAHGQTAGLVEQLPTASDVFTTTIGNVPAGAEIKVEVTYLGELKHDTQIDGVRLTIPTIIAPRYGSYPGKLITSHTQSNGGIKITVDAEVPAGSHIVSLQSPSHPLAVTLGRTSIAPDAEPSLQKASATLSLGTAELEKDFILQMQATNTGNPVAILETHPTIRNQRALMATLVPKFQLPAEKPEIVFVCDRSGSMDSKINKLKAALRLFVKSLSVGMKFNICSFGSRHSFLWDRSRTYDHSSVEEAMNHIDTFSANYGGTEMYRPVEDVFERRYTDMNLEVFLLTDGEIWNQDQLVNMINGHVSSSNGTIRLFSLGIGRAASHALIESVARAGNGFSQSVSDNEEIGSKIIRMLKGALFPHVKDYSLEVKYTTDSADSHEDFEMIEKVSERLFPFSPTSSTATIAEENAKPVISLFDPSVDTEVEKKNASDEDRYSHLPKVEVPRILQAPFEIPPLFPFNRTSFYLLISTNTNRQTPTSVILRGNSTHGPLELEIPITILEKKGKTIHQLAAKKAVGELEQGRGWIHHARSSETPGQLLKQKYDGHFQDMVEREAVRLGVQYQVGGKWCSFVAVEANDQHGEKAEPTPTTLQQLPVEQLRMQSSPYQQPPRGTSLSVQIDSPHPRVRHAAAFQTYGGAPGSITGYASPSVAQIPAPSSHISAFFSESLSGNDASQVGNLDFANPICTQDILQDFDFDSFLHDGVDTLSAEQVGPPSASTTKATHPYIRSTALLNSNMKPKRRVTPRSDGVEITLNKDTLSEDPIKALVVLQKFEGFWTRSQQLINLIKFDEAKITAAVNPEMLKAQDGQNLMATACVVVWLDKEKAQDGDTWELLVEKAVAWLEGEIGEIRMHELLDAVRRVM
ncbi:von willebrand domain containing protein [Seiridium cupressi]